MAEQIRASGDAFRNKRYIIIARINGVEKMATCQSETTDYPPKHADTIYLGTDVVVRYE